MFTASTGIKFSNNVKGELSSELFVAESLIKNHSRPKHQQRRWSSLILYYRNSMKTFRLLLSGDVETNPPGYKPEYNHRVTHGGVVDKLFLNFITVLYFS